MSGRSLERPPYSFDLKILTKALTEKYDLSIDLSDHVEYGFSV